MLNIICRRIVETWTMPPVPVHTAIEPHVEADQHDPPSAELNREIERLKAGVAAVAHHSRLIDKNVIDFPPDSDLPDIRETVTRRRVMCQL